MADFTEKYGPWAIVAGAAEGLGRAYCTQLARRQMNLVMVDYQENLSTELSRELENQYGVKTKIITTDLSEQDSWKIIADACMDLDTGLLVYNAAGSIVKPFLEQNHENIDYQVLTNNRTLSHLILWFAGKLEGRRKGGILIMSSLAGFFGTPFVPVYSASKAFCFTLAEALSQEFSDKGIDVMACMAGATGTPAFYRTNPGKVRMGPSIMKPEIVAEQAIRQLGRKVLYIPGTHNKLSYFLLRRIFPRKIARTVIGGTMKKMYGKQQAY